MKSSKKKVFIKSLGCPKNEVDGDVILGYLQKHGIDVVDNPEDADYLLVNSCAFIESAKQESIEEILNLSKFKNNGTGPKRLFVSGCLAQRYPNEILQEIPEVDGMIGIDQYDKITSILDKDSVYITRPPSLYKESHSLQAMRDRSYVYLKISDGCDARCTYCAIPMMRGNHRSRQLSAIESDVDRFLENDNLEINLIGQDVAYYGRDIGVSPIALLEMLDKKKADFWVRPFYLHPLNISDDLLDYFASSKKFCKYLEIPIQHINSIVLEKMNRNYDQKFIHKLLDRIRNKLPDTIWRTTFIVGFPGETKKQFKQLCDFIEDQKIVRGGVFNYSHEDGTAAYKLKNTHSRTIIDSRQEELMAIINEQADSFNQSLVGKHFEMIPESYDNIAKAIRGRIYCDAPEIDFITSLKSNSFDRRKFISVKITGVNDEGFEAVEENL